MANVQMPPQYIQYEEESYMPNVGISQLFVLCKKEVLIMKKSIVFLLTIVVFMISSMCSAAIQSTVSLGGVSIGMPYKDVIAMFGTPNKTFEHKTQDGRLLSRYIEYGDTVQIMFDYNGDRLGGVANVFVVANNGWKLPNGIGVGSNINEIRRLYGMGECHSKGEYGDYWEFKLSDGTTITATIDIDPELNGMSDKITSLQIGKGNFPEYNFYSRTLHS